MEDFRCAPLVINNITEWHNLVEANRQLENQINGIAKLRHEYRHSISVVKWARREAPATYNYTCYMYAFDLMDHTLLNSIAGRSPLNRGVAHL